MALSTIDTLQQLAQFINNASNYYNTIINAIATKANSSDVNTKTQTCTQTEINKKNQQSKIPLQHQQL